MFPSKEGNTVVEELATWAKRRGMMSEGASDEAGIALLEFQRWTVGETLQES